MPDRSGVSQLHTKVQIGSERINEIREVAVGQAFGYRRVASCFKVARFLGQQSQLMEEINRMNIHHLRVHQDPEFCTRTCLVCRTTTI